MNTKESYAKEVPIGNLYEMNKSVMNKAAALKSDEIENRKDSLISFFIKNDCNYYMLLCNERKDYTVFHIYQKITVESELTAASEVIECLKNRGEILAIDYMEETGAYECWIRRSGMSYMYALFPYDAAVIEC